MDEFTAVHNLRMIQISSDKKLILKALELVQPSL